MSEQFEGDPPLLAVAVERGGVLVDAHDQANAVLEVLVDEGDAVADAEVGTTGNLWRRTWSARFDIRWCLANRYRRGEILQAVLDPAYTLVLRFSSQDIAVTDGEQQELDLVEEGDY